MAYPDDLLTRGEHVVLHRRPHWKMLVVPMVVFVVIIAGAFALAGWLRNWTYHNIAWIVIAVLAVAGLVAFCLAPYIRWRTEHFVVTNYHVFFRTGLIRRREHQIPLARIQNLETVVSIPGRLFGYGTLIVESASDDPLAFTNIASLGKVRSMLNQLIMDRHHDDDRDAGSDDRVENDHLDGERHGR